MATTIHVVSDDFRAGFQAAREHFGCLETETDTLHYAECDKTENLSYRCTCESEGWFPRGVYQSETLNT